MATQTTTAYKRLAEAIRQRILGGEWRAGEQIPTEHRLCEEFSASRITVRRALQIMEEERLIHRRQGSGTFVSPTPVRKIPILNTDFFASVVRHAPELRRRVEANEWVQADEYLAGQLETVPGERLLHAVRVDELRGEPVAADELWLPGRMADRLDAEDLTEMNFLVRWQAVEGIRLDYGTQSIEAVKARSPWAGLLDVRSGEPLLKETNTLYLLNGQRAGLFVSHYRPDCFRFDATVPMGGGPTAVTKKRNVRG
ncbi:MAG: GntR family transcriptional regulator [Phycisphaerales bacterium]